MLNNDQWRYMLGDAKLGLQRNKGSVLASVALLFIALSLIGTLLLTRAYFADAVTYVESQLAMKVYVEDGLVDEVADVLRKQSYTDDVTIETGETMLSHIAFFFHGKEQLLQSFQDGAVPDAVKFTVNDVAYMDVIQQQLQGVTGIVEVVYPQQMAELLEGIVTTVERLSVASVVIFFALAFGIVYVTFHLAMYQREQELRVKLFLGMDPRVVRTQFLVEGSVIGCIGALLSLAVTSAVYCFVFIRLQRAMPYLGSIDTNEAIIIGVIQLVSGMFIAITASYISTRKGLRDG